MNPKEFYNVNKEKFEQEFSYCIELGVVFVNRNSKQNRVKRNNKRKSSIQKKEVIVYEEKKATIKKSSKSYRFAK